MLTYSFDSGWIKTDYSKEFGVQDGLRKISYALDAVQESLFSYEVYSFDDESKVVESGFEYLVTLTLGGQAKDVAVRDLPSLIELLSKISAVNMSDLFRVKEAERINECVKDELDRMSR